MNCLSRAIAVILQIADGIPSGWTFVLSSASFSRATRYVGRNICTILDGCWDFCICEVLDESSEVGWIDAVWLVAMLLYEVCKFVEDV